MHIVILYYSVIFQKKNKSGKFNNRFYISQKKIYNEIMKSIDVILTY